MINWVYFPKSSPLPEFGLKIVAIFEDLADNIDSSTTVGQHSDTVMARLRPGLEKLGFRVEKGKSSEGKIVVPVLFGRKGKILKCFNADAHPLIGVGFLKSKRVAQSTTISFSRIFFRRA